MDLNQIASLLELSLPPFVYINDPVSPKLTLQSLLSSLESKVRLVHIDGIACFTPRLLYDSILNGLAQHTPSWNEGCENWSEHRYNENFDTFLHGMRDLHASLSKNLVGNETRIRLAVVIEKPERLKDRMPDLMVPLTRMAELTKLDLTVVFVSEARWEDIRPPLGAAVDPYYVDVPIPTKEAIAAHLLSVFEECSMDSNLASSSSTPHAYDPILLPTYTKFVSVLLEVCWVYTKDPLEVQYIAAARWPGFIKPLLDAHRLNLAESDEADAEFEAPSMEIWLRLSNHFKPSLSLAMEQLYPRFMNAVDWARENEPDEASLAKDGLILSAASSETMVQEEEAEELDEELTPQSSPSRKRSSARIRNQEAAKNTSSFNPADALALSASLPRLSQFILIAAFIASMNPVKTDLRMFGRSVDEKKRRRRVARRQKNAKPKSGPAKIPQRHLGPAPFALDRLVAILAALVEENDPVASDVQEDVDPADGLDFKIPGERTDYEVSRVRVYASIAQLTSLRLLIRTTTADKLESPSTMFKCGPGLASSYEMILGLAKGLGVPLPDLLWDDCS